jgi:hypothetical protein
MRGLERMKFILIVGILLIVTCRFADTVDALQIDVLCDVHDVRLTYDGSVGRFLNNDLETSSRAEGTLIFENTGSVPITKLLFLVDYIDGQHRRMFTLIYNRVVGAQKLEPFFGRRLPITVPSANDPVAAGQQLKVLGSSPVTSTNCPSGAEVTMVNVSFADGRSTSWSNPDWHLDADIASAPNFELPHHLVQRSTEFLVRVQVSSEGKVLGVKPLDQTLVSPLIAAVEEQFPRWVFLPPLQGGKPLASDITLLIRIHANPKWSPPAKATLGIRSEAPFVVVDLVPKKHSKSGWYLSFAHRGVPSP